MENKTGDKILGDSLASEPETQTGEIIPGDLPATNNQNQETANMEVHHHSHSHGQKNWKSYIWEFLMLFLAVFCGFLAEYQLEHVIEHQREKEYIISMIEDAKTDTANLHATIASNTLRSERLDTLASLCLNYDVTGKDDETIYRLYRYAVVHPAFITPTERTIQQLKNAGGMRLIRNKAAVDSIILYDDMSKKLADQQAYYELYQNKSIDIASQILNFQYLRSQRTVISAIDSIVTASGKKLVNRDKLKVMEFGNKLSVYGGVVYFYTVRLQEMNEHAIHLIQTLQKEYHLENE